MSYLDHDGKNVLFGFENSFSPQFMGFTFNNNPLIPNNNYAFLEFRLCLCVCSHSRRINSLNYTVAKGICHIK